MFITVLFIKGKAREGLNGQRRGLVTVQQNAQWNNTKEPLEVKSYGRRLLPDIGQGSYVKVK